MNEYLIDFYSSVCDEDARFASRHGSVEFLTTMRYVEKYIKPGDRIIEIGAATGRYSHALARMGYAVDAVELIDHNIEVFKKNTQPGENITIVQGNAMDLSDFTDDSYDITLLLGPLYHLYSQSDKRRAVGEAIRMTKPGGVIFAAHVVTDGCILGEGFKLGEINLLRKLEIGLLDPKTFALKSEPRELFEFVRKEDIDELMSVFPIKRLHYVATDGYTCHMSEAVDKMNDAMFELYLKYHFATCERGDMVGISCHSIDVFQKL